MTTLYLIRHAEAEGNIERRFQGHYNGKISENGEKQLRYLKKRFRKIHLNAVYTSPLSRAVATADAVNYYAAAALKEKNMQKFRNCSPKNGNTGTGNLINLKRQAVKPCASVMNG